MWQIMSSSSSLTYEPSLFSLLTHYHITTVAKKLCNNLQYYIFFFLLYKNATKSKNQGWQFVFACRVRVVSSHEYSTTQVNTNPTCLLNGSRFLNPNPTHLLNGSVVSTCLVDFIKMKKKIYEKTKKINIFNIKFRINE